MTNPVGETAVLAVVFSLPVSLSLDLALVSGSSGEAASNICWLFLRVIVYL